MDASAYLHTMANWIQIPICTLYSLVSWFCGSIAAHHLSLCEFNTLFPPHNFVGGAAFSRILTSLSQFTFPQKINRNSTTDSLVARRVPARRRECRQLGFELPTSTENSVRTSNATSIPFSSLPLLVYLTQTDFDTWIRASLFFFIFNFDKMGCSQITILWDWTLWYIWYRPELLKWQAFHFRSCPATRMGLWGCIYHTYLYNYIMEPFRPTRRVWRSVLESTNLHEYISQRRYASAQTRIN